MENEILVKLQAAFEKEKEARRERAMAFMDHFKRAAEQARNHKNAEKKEE